MTELFASIAGVIIGGYINHILTWKISNRVELLKLMYKNIQEIKIGIINFYSSKIFQTDNVESQIIKYLEQLSSLAMQDDLVDNKFQFEIQIFINSLTELRNGDKKEAKEIFIESSDNLCIKIIIYINKVTSVCYMLKKLIPWSCNK